MVRKYTSTGAFSGDWAQRKNQKLDQRLWAALKAVLPPPPLTICDIGAGAGRYVHALLDSGYRAAGIDGASNIEQISEGVVLQYDLIKRITWKPKAQWAMSIEVGEHIPQRFEGIYLDNVAGAASDGLILSWALPGQKGKGHVNCREEAWVIRELRDRGWEVNVPATAAAKQVCEQLQKQLGGRGRWHGKLNVYQPLIETAK